MAKAIAEQSNRFSVSFLKEHGYLERDLQTRYGSIAWSRHGEVRSSIGFYIYRNSSGDPDHITLQYQNTNRDTGEKENMDYAVPLVTTPCHFGSHRYWFICPLTKDDAYCGRRVGALFSIGKWFGCRHCGEIAYDSQMKGGKYRGSVVTIPDIEEMEKKVKRMFYRGNMTRKYRRLLRMSRKLKADIIRVGLALRS